MSDPVHWSMRGARCECGRVGWWHCSFDEPGVDHPADCRKRHHEFRERAHD